jgi:hypothetical protein
MAWSPLRRSNAGISRVEHPGDYATPNPNHLRDGTDDQPADVLTNGVELWITRNDGPWIRTTVVSASLDEVVIEMEDGSRWLMSPLRFGETDSGIRPQGLYSQDWKIRSDSD